MQHLLDLLASIPNVVWSGLIASILTLSGVFLSNRSNTDRLLLQLKHDAAEKAKERTGALRRETYLRAAEELAKINAHISSLPQVDITKVNAAEGMQGFFTAAARLQLVAEPKTALLVNKLAARYAELVFTVMTNLVPVANAKSDIGIADDHYTKAQAEITRLLSEMAKQNETGAPNQDVFRALSRSFDYQSARADEHAKRRGEAWTRFNSASVSFHRAILTEIRDIGGQQIQVMVEIRRDLGLTGDLTEIEQFMKEQWIKMERRFDELLHALNKDA
ncbi:hypothetical protein [Polaromonas sp.]|uniref:hypothetical protein n=1 Tax=Polaromonas sp. TaxID=1869339 RepID=UPI003264B9B3